MNKNILLLLIIITIVVLVTITLSSFISFIYISSNNTSEPTEQNNDDINDQPTEEIPLIEEIYFDEIPPTPINTSNEIVVKMYDSANYKGLLGSYTVGRYNFSKNDNINDDISSVKVTNGYEVYMYRDSDFKNPIGKTSKDIPDLGKYRNEISSFIVKKK